MGHYAARIQEDPVALAIVSLIERKVAWTGTASELLGEIRPQNASNDWPTTAQAMGGRLKRITPALKAMGIEVDQGRAKDRSRSRRIAISKVVPVVVQHDQIVQEEVDPNHYEELSDMLDDADNMDNPDVDYTTEAEREPQEWR